MNFSKNNGLYTGTINNDAEIINITDSNFTGNVAQMSGGALLNTGYIEMISGAIFLKTMQVLEEQFKTARSSLSFKAVHLGKTTH